MKNLIRSEWIKFRSVRSTVVTLLIAGAIVGIVALFTARHAAHMQGVTSCQKVSATATTTTPPVVDPQAGNYCGDGMQAVTTRPATNLSGLTGGVTFAVLLFGVLGVQVIGQEYRFNTIRPTFTAVPDRYKVLLAKLIVVTAASAAISVVMVGVCWLIGHAMIDNFVVDGTDRRVALGIVIFAALWTMAGVGVGAIVRQPIAGILILAGESLIGENLLGAIWSGSIRWLPFSNGIQMTLRLDDPGSHEHLQSVLVGGIYFGLVCAALFAIGTLLVDRRDA